MQLPHGCATVALIQQTGNLGEVASENCWVQLAWGPNMSRLLETIKEHSHGASNQEILRALCNDVLENTQAELVSVWEFDDNHTQIHCIESVSSCRFTSVKDHVLKRKDFRKYFDAILEHFKVNAPDVFHQPDTAELIDTYFRPHHIKSLLDYIIHHKGETVGVICCETISNHVEWSARELKYIHALSVSAGFELSRK